MIVAKEAEKPKYPTTFLDALEAFENATREAVVKAHGAKVTRYTALIASTATNVEKREAESYIAAAGPLLEADIVEARAAALKHLVIHLRSDGGHERS
jgi:hypothetical protein